MTRQAVAARMEALFADYDLLVLPGFHVPAPPVPGLPDWLRGKAPALTCWANHTGQPVASVPCGLTRDAAAHRHADRRAALRRRRWC